MMLRGTPFASRVRPEIRAPMLVAELLARGVYVAPVLSVIVPDSRRVSFVTEPNVAQGVEPAGNDVFHS
ncbi:hypothetical protein D3C81_1985250 [compost metagenome]